ncbi:hypothetical protein [Flavobacterium pedocola]
MIKQFIKKYFYVFWLKDKFSAAVQIGQVQLFQLYREKIESGKTIDFNTTGFKVFSQFEEDGKLLYLFSVIGMGNKRFVDIGSDDGINSNCANFAVNFGWNGLFIDADKTALSIGEKFYAKYPNPWTLKPKFKQAVVTPQNINQIISGENFSGEIELLSIDIDSNDYWIWKALETIEPKIVVIESQVAFGNRNLVVPYQDGSSKNPNQDLYYGASTSALVKLGKEKNYRLVGSNAYGNNLFFVKNGIAEKELPEIAAETTLNSPYVAEKSLQFEKIKHLPFIEL